MTFSAAAVPAFVQHSVFAGILSKAHIATCKTSVLHSRCSMVCWRDRAVPSSLTAQACCIHRDDTCHDPGSLVYTPADVMLFCSIEVIQEQAQGLHVTIQMYGW